MTNFIRTIHSEQFQIPCIVVDDQQSLTAENVINACRAVGAVRNVDGEEFCVQFRSDVGPELWTESAIRRSVKS